MPPCELRDRLLAYPQILATTLSTTQKVAGILRTNSWDSGDAILGSNTISRYDVLLAIPSCTNVGISFSITNTTCHSGKWLEMAYDIKGQNTHTVAVATPKPDGKQFPWSSRLPPLWKLYVCSSLRAADEPRKRHQRALPKSGLGGLAR